MPLPGVSEEHWLFEIVPPPLGLLVTLTLPCGAVGVPKVAVSVTVTVQTTMLLMTLLDGLHEIVVVVWRWTTNVENDAGVGASAGPIPPK